MWLLLQRPHRGDIAHEVPSPYSRLYARLDAPGLLSRPYGAKPVKRDCGKLRARVMEDNMLKAAGIAALFAMADQTPRHDADVDTQDKTHDQSGSGTGRAAAAGLDRPGPDQRPRHRAVAPVAARRPVRDRRGLRPFHLLFRPIKRWRAPTHSGTTHRFPRFPADPNITAAGIAARRRIWRRILCIPLSQKS